VTVNGQGIAGVPAIIDGPSGKGTPIAVLAASGIRKRFGGVTALDGVDFRLGEREIHGLIGQNGAGKSTLVKILNGVHRPDEGRLELAGEPLILGSPLDARRAGIAMVFQEFSLIPTLSVAHNVLLGHESRAAGIFTDERAGEKRAATVLSSLGVQIDPRAAVGSLPVGSQQLVEIAKAMSWEPRILILDEPTASLSGSEVEILFRVLRRLRETGVSIVYISHHLQEILTVCDAITVLRDGRVELVGRAGETSIAAMVVAMTGRSMDSMTQHRASGSQARATPAGPLLLELRDWNLGQRLADVRLDVRVGEVLGVAGLLGSGRTSLLRSIVGLEPAASGELRLAGEPIRPRSPADAADAGIAYVPEDRRRQGIVAGQSVQQNLLLGIWDRLVSHFLLSDDAANGVSRELIERLNIRTSGPSQLIEQLSGGNQQKVVVGRSLAREPRVLLLDDPTVGIDIGSRRELLGHIRRFADNGGAVVLVSSELEELGAVADRVIVLSRGRVTNVLDGGRGDDLSESGLLSAIHAPAAEAA
jgi:ribose transport system ATP-binding protein